jgi:hypothetical protein
MDKKVPETKKRGRPRVYDTAVDRVRAYRERQRECRRIDGYITPSASWRLTRLSEAWNCSKGKVMERLILEADERYKDVLFPETD